MRTESTVHAWPLAAAGGFADGPAFLADGLGAFSRSPPKGFFVALFNGKGPWAGLATGMPHVSNPTEARPRWSPRGPRQKTARHVETIEIQESNWKVEKRRDRQTMAMGAYPLDRQGIRADIEASLVDYKEPPPKGRTGGNLSPAADAPRLQIWGDAHRRIEGPSLGGRQGASGGPLGKQPAPGSARQKEPRACLADKPPAGRMENHFPDPPRSEAPQQTVLSQRAKRVRPHHANSWKKLFSTKKVPPFIRARGVIPSFRPQRAPEIHWRKRPSSARVSPPTRANEKHSPKATIAQGLQPSIFDGKEPQGLGPGAGSPNYEVQANGRDSAAKPGKTAGHEFYYKQGKLSGLRPRGVRVSSSPARRPNKRAWRSGNPGQGRTTAYGRHVASFSGASTIPPRSTGKSSTRAPGQHGSALRDWCPAPPRALPAGPVRRMENFEEVGTVQGGRRFKVELNGDG